MTIEISKWNIGDYLNGAERMAGYLEAASEIGDPVLLAAAVEDVANANVSVKRISPNGSSSRRRPGSMNTKQDH